MALVTEGHCVVSRCEEVVTDPKEMFCATHWRQLDRERRQEIIRLREVNARQAEFSEPYAIALADAVIEIERAAAKEAK